MSEFQVLVLIFGQIWAGVILAFAVVGAAMMVILPLCILRPMRGPPVPEPWMPPPSPMERLRAEQERFNRENPPPVSL